MAVKGDTIDDLPRVASARELAGALVEVEVLSGPGGARVNKGSTIEQLAEATKLGASANNVPSLLKEFRFFRAVDRDADSSGGACFETDIDYATCCTLTRARIEFYREADDEDFRQQDLECVYDGSATPAGLAYVDGNFSGTRNPSKFVKAGGGTAPDAYTKAEADALLSRKAPLASPALSGSPTAPTPGIGNKSEQIATTRFVQDLLSLSYTKAYPIVCVRADGTHNFTFTTLETAVPWTNAGGPGSITFLNRPVVINNIVVLGPGTILDVQQNPVDLNAWVIRLGNHSEIRNNRLLYSGRIAPDYGDGTPFSVKVQGGTLAGRTNFLINNGATVIFDGVTIADFGQQQLGGLNVGPATSSETGVTVILRNGSYFEPGYQPHPNTVIVVESAGAGGALYRDPYAVGDKPAVVAAVTDASNTWTNGDLTAYATPALQDAGAPPADPTGQASSILVGTADVAHPDTFDKEDVNGGAGWRYVYGRRNDGTSGWTRTPKG